MECLNLPKEGAFAKKGPLFHGKMGLGPLPLWGRGRCQKALQKHSLGHFPAWAPWRSFCGALIKTPSISRNVCSPCASNTCLDSVKFSASSKPTTEFAQPRLSRVKARSSPARGYYFGCVCSYMAGHYPDILMTGHIGTKTSKFVPPRWG